MIASRSNVVPISPKLREYHWTRLAVVYVRQSSPQQVLEHRESTARQYALVDRAVALGWSRERVVVIDEDQGHSGQSVEGRPGFQRLLAEVGLDHVGLVLGLEMSRLARSCKDWHQLLELCGVFRTLLADGDGLYDPTDYNDRLLLGLKGTMSEAELHILKNRMLEGMRNKARRGELLNHPPLGYVRVTGNGYQMDPDEQVQAVVRLIFDAFERQGSLHGLLRYLKSQDIRLPIRPHLGPNRGQLEWRRPNRVTLQNVLHRPIYAGAYCWGQRAIDPRRQKPGRPGTGRTVKAPEECLVLLKDRFPAYISWERFQAIQKRLADNRALASSRGAAREGPSLLAGLLVCGRCGRRLLTSYGGPASRLRYTCCRATIDYGESICLGLAGAPLDALVAHEALQVLQPLALEVSLATEAQLRSERQQLEQHWQQRRERSAFAVDRAARQYAAVEPENRLVARELERRWEESLQDQRGVEEEYDRFCRGQPAELTAAQRAAIHRLAEDVPRLWHAATTTPQDRQEVIRLLLEQVAVTVDGESERVAVTLHWAGGCVSHHRLIRPVARYEQLSYYGSLRARVAALQAQGCNCPEIARQLNAEGFRPPKRTNRFTTPMVTRFLVDEGLHIPSPQAVANRRLLGRHELWLTELAVRLNIPLATLHKWQRIGWLRSRKVSQAGGRWAIWADDAELTRLRQLRAYRRQWPAPCYPQELTTPGSSRKGKQ
jgi:DNA invertase Pin-like site-specific DNA recombinase